MHRSLYFLLIFPLATQAQYFQKVTVEEGINLINTTTNQGNGVSLYDINHDGWDDITFCTNGDTLVVYENLQGAGFQYRELIPNVTFDQKTAMWVDYDGDGDSDVMMTRNGNRTRLFRNEGNWVFSERPTSELGLTTAPGTSFYGQSWADYDKDGDLDVYLCNHSYGPNALLRNNGNGTFTNVAAAAGVTAGSSLSFQSAWMDYDLDGWPDLFVIHENLPMATEIYPNKLYRNNGNGTFTDVATAAGVDAVIQAMNLGFSDFDLDGDQDLYVTDIQDGNIFYRNNGDGTYTDIATESGLLVNNFCWSALWIDADHNGYDDLHICTRFTINNRDYFYYNNGDGTFTDTQDPLFANVFEDTYSSAKGDYNNDGFWDFAITKGATTSYDLFAGIPNENHWLKFDLTGTYSNKEAVGTWIKVYTNGSMRHTYTMSGEHYLGQDSQYEIISLGSAAVADSVEIIWPRGLVEKLYNVSADQTLSLVEGDNTPVTITASNDNFVICENGDLVLDAGEWTSYAWSTGSVERSIVVTEPNVYWVEVTNALGYTFTGNVFVNAASLPVATVNITHPLCNGDNNGSVTLETLTENATLVWDNGSISNLTGLSAGEYSGTISSQEGCSQSISVVLEDPAPLGASVLTNTFSPSCFGTSDGVAQITTTTESATILWQDGSTDFERSDLPVGTHAFTVFNSFGCSYAASITIDEPLELVGSVSTTQPLCFGETGSASASLEGGTEPYSIDWLEANPTALSAGTYEAIATDNNGCTTTITFEIVAPEILAFTTDVTNPFNGANGTIAVIPSGGTEPYAILWNDGSVSFERTNLEQGSYSYTITDANGCSVGGENALVDTNVKETNVNMVQLMPNPCASGETLRIVSNQSIHFIAVYDLQGKLVLSQKGNFTRQTELSIPTLSSGVYTVVVQSNDSVSAKRLEVMR